MKQTITIIAIHLLMLTAPACRHDPSQAPPDFTAYRGNPILSPGEPGSWDELFVWTPQVLFYSDTFYMFYHGGSINGKMSIGLAISHNGYDFIKYEGNPILSPDNEGFDSFTVGPGIVFKSDSLWIMYYNAQDLVTFAPGKYAGRATAVTPYGPWKKSEKPVVTSGTTGEWDAGFLVPSSVTFQDEKFIMYYSGGKDISAYDDFHIGMAYSSDGLNWVKYQDPSTTSHPFLESDPVLVSDPGIGWERAFLWMANVSYSDGSYKMYYAGAGGTSREELKSIGYATSIDGVNWTKYPENPILQTSDDPYIIGRGNSGFMENPDLLITDTILFLYYECGPAEIQKSYISLATARVP